MKVYIVQRYGVYDQGVCGVYPDIESARQRAKEAKAQEKDGYHAFDIIECEMGRAVDPDEYRAGGTPPYERQQGGPAREIAAERVE